MKLDKKRIEAIKAYLEAIEKEAVALGIDDHLSLCIINNNDPGKTYNRYMNVYSFSKKGPEFSMTAWDGEWEKPMPLMKGGK